MQKLADECCQLKENLWWVIAQENLKSEVLEELVCYGNSTGPFPNNNSSTTYDMNNIGLRKWGKLFKPFHNKYN